MTLQGGQVLRRLLRQKIPAKALLGTATSANAVPRKTRRSMTVVSEESYRSAGYLEQKDYEFSRLNFLRCTINVRFNLSARLWRGGLNIAFVRPWYRSSANSMRSKSLPYLKHDYLKS